MNKLYICLLSLFLISCSTKTKEDLNIPTIAFDQEGKPFCKDEIICDFIPLETNEKSLIKKIGQIEFFDNRIFIFDNVNHLFLVFDMNGKFITQVGDYGQGPGEYTLPIQFCIDKEKNAFIICDIDTQKLVYYDLDNYTYMYTENVSRYTYCSLLENGKFVWFYTAGFNSEGKKYYLTTTDQQFKNKNYLCQANFTSHFGMLTGSLFHNFDKKTFFHTSFEPTIWEITTNAIPRYNISFGKHKLPPLKWLKEQESSSVYYVMSIQNTNYVSAYNLTENSTFINVLYYVNKSIYLGFYNKQTKVNQKYTYPQFIKYAEIDGGMSEILGVYNNYFIVTLSPSILKKYTIRRNNLRLIAEKISEEDNPILCLFKFK